MMPESAKYSNNERVRLQRLAEELLIAKQSKIDAAKKEQDGILGMKNKEGGALASVRPWWKSSPTQSSPFSGGANTSEEDGHPLDEQSEYYDEAFVDAGLRDGILFRGKLDQSAHIPFEAWVNLEAGIFLNLQTGGQA